MRLRIWMCLIFGLFLSAEGLVGQEYRGSLSGRVLDQSGAGVPGAHVTFTNTDTNVRLTTDTNVEGNYTLPYLQPGIYSLRVEHQGFKAFERSPIEVRIDSAVVVDAQMELGSATETVNVRAEAPLLDLASANQGETVDDKRVEELPIQQGVPYHLMALTPGLVKTGTNMLDENPYDGTIISYSIGGQSASNNLIIVDGAVTGGFSGGSISPSFSPPEYSVGEFRVLTSSYSAEQGWGNGANVSVSLKSGTDTIHGGIADYGGGDGNLVANNYLSMIKGLPHVPTGPYRRRELGVGGPVYIPKIYDGRKKTFWFFGFTNLDRTQVLTQSFTVPTVAERSGDFSALLPLGSSYVIYDPFSRQPAANGRVSSVPIPNNIIPASVLATPASKIGVGLLQYWPLPNATAAQAQRQTAPTTGTATTAARAMSIGGWTCASIRTLAIKTGFTAPCTATTATIRITTFSRITSAEIRGKYTRAAVFWMRYTCSARASSWICAWGSTTTTSWSRVWDRPL